MSSSQDNPSSGNASGSRSWLPFPFGKSVKPSARTEEEEQMIIDRLLDEADTGDEYQSESPAAESEHEDAEYSQQDEGDESSKEIDDSSGDDNEGSGLNDEALQEIVEKLRQENDAANARILQLSQALEDLHTEITDLRLQTAKVQDMERQLQQLPQDLERFRLENIKLQQQSKHDQKLVQELLQRDNQNRKIIQEMSKASDRSVRPGKPNNHSLQRFNNALKKIDEAAAL